MRRFNAILLASVLFFNSAIPVAASYESSEDASLEASSYSSAMEIDMVSDGLSTEESSDSSSEGYSEELIIIEEETTEEASEEASSAMSSTEEEDPDFYEEFPTGLIERDEDVDFESVTEGGSGSMLYGSSSYSYLPSSYVTENLPDLRNQYPYGTCWAFSTISLAEINLANKGQNLDLSELHTAYFGYRWVQDPLSGFGDFTAPGPIEKMLNWGGRVEQGLAAFERWSGVASEDVANYKNEAALANSVGLSDEIAYLDEVHLVNSYVEPIDVNNLGPVKNLVYTYGAANVNYYALNSMSAATSASVYNSANNCYYNPKSNSPNHAVTIVGWDDNFSKDKFSQKPPGDGAFLIRNSWTTGDFDHNQSYSGYFWMSYYETSLDHDAIAAEFDTADDYDNNYQYDQVFWPAYVPLKKGANIFTAHSEWGYYGEEIKAVAFETSSSNISGRIDIYTGLSEDATDPESGILAGSTTFETTYAGYYTIPLDEAVFVDKGERFSVVITNTGDNTMNFALECNTNINNYAFKPDRSGNSRGVYATDNTNYWVDYNDLIIKAFTDNADPGIIVPVERISFDGIEDDELDLGVGEKHLVEASIYPEDATNRNLTWKSSNVSVATVSDGMITGIKEGRATITATALGGAKKSFTVNVVNKLQLLKISLGTSSTWPMSLGGTIYLKAEPTPSTYKFKEKVKWSVEPADAATIDQTNETMIPEKLGIITIKAEVDGFTATRTEGVFPKEDHFVYDVDDDNIITFTWEGVPDATEYTFTDNGSNSVTVTEDGSSSYRLDLDWFRNASTFGTRTIKVKTRIGDSVSQVTLSVKKVSRICNVTFDLNYGSNTFSNTAEYSGLLTQPGTPTRYGYRFMGWYLDKECTQENKFNFGLKVKENITEYKDFTLYAKWDRNPSDIMITGLSIAGIDGDPEIKVGETVRLRAIPVPLNTTLPDVTWSSSDSAIASIDEIGILIGKKAGAVILTATSLADENIKAEFYVEVYSKESGRPAKELRILDTQKVPYFLGSSSDEPTMTLYGTAGNGDSHNVTLKKFTDEYGDSDFDGLQLAVGKSYNLKADFLPKWQTVSRNKATYSELVKDREVFWISENPAIATVLAGKVTAKSSGITTITAIAEESGLEASCQVIVYDAVTLLSLNTTSLKLGAGQTYDLLTTVSPLTASDKVYYKSSNEKVAVIDEDGVITAKTAGSASITVTAQGGKTARCSVTVGKPVTSISVSGKKDTDGVCVGKTLQLVTTFNDPKNQPVNKTVTYGIVDEDEDGNEVIVEKNDIASITQKGLVTGKSEGKVRVRVTSTTDKRGGEYVYGEMDVYVYDGLKSASINQKSLTMVPGSSYNLEIALLSASGKEDVTHSYNAASDSFRHVKENSRIAWSVTPDDGSVTIKASDGSTLANLGRTDGTCKLVVADNPRSKAVTVKATFRPYGAAKETVLSCKVTVKSGAITGLTPSPSTVSVSRGDTAELSAKLAPMAPANGALYWEIPDEYADDLCFVDPDGNVLGQTAGTDVGDSFGNKVIVKALPGALENALSTRKVTVKVTTLGKNAKNAQISKNITVNILNGPSVVRILQGKNVVSVSDDETDSAKPVAISLKKSISLKATIFADQDCKVKACNQKVIWKSSDQEVATVNSAGKVTAVSNGTAIISASVIATGYEDGKKVEVDVAHSNVRIEVYTPATKLTLDKTKMYLNTGTQQNSGSQYGAVAVALNPWTVFENGQYSPYNVPSKNMYPDKVTWTVSGTGAVVLSAVDEDEIRNSGKRIDLKQSTLEGLPYEEADSFTGTGQGQMLAVKASRPGTVKLTATAGGKSASCTITIYSHVTGIDSLPSQVNVKVKKTIALKPVLAFDGMSMPDKNAPDYKALLGTYNLYKKMASGTTLYYKSLDEAVATVNAKGRITGKKKGTATIVVTSGEGNISRTVTVKVE